MIADGLGLDIEPEYNQQYRAGDIRHCLADIDERASLLGFEAQGSFEDGMGELLDWLKGQHAVDRVDAATSELAARGLTK